MDFSRDELRRQSAALDVAHRPLLVRWRRVLDEVFDPANPHRPDPDDRAAVLGLPGRRQFLRIGGLAVASSAILVGCGSDPQDATPPASGAGGSSTTAAGAPGAMPVTTSPATTGPATTGPAIDAGDLDATLLRTASSIELLARDAYQAALESSLLEDPALVEAVGLFQRQHDEHHGALSAQTKAVGGEPFTQPNPFLQEQVVGPALAAVTDQVSLLRLALDLEDTAAQTYALAGGMLSRPDLRKTIMSIGGVEARHAAVLLGVLGGAGIDQVPVPFLPTTGAVPEESFV